MTDQTPDPSAERVEVRTDATDRVSLVVTLSSCAVAAVFFIGSTVGGGGWPAAVAACGLAGMILAVSYLLLRRS